MNKILNRIGTGFLLVALYLRVTNGTEPAYYYALIGAVLLAISTWRVIN